MTRTITTADPEFQDVLRELALNREAVIKRRELSNDSFREWLYEQVVEIGHRLGLTIQNASEFAKDLAYGFQKGFQQGRQEARDRSIRAREANS